LVAQKFDVKRRFNDCRKCQLLIAKRCDVIQQLNRYSLDLVVFAVR